MDAIDSQLSYWWMEAVTEVSARSDNVLLSFIVRRFYGLDGLWRGHFKLSARAEEIFL